MKKKQEISAKEKAHLPTGGWKFEYKVHGLINKIGFTFNILSGLIVVFVLTNVQNFLVKEAERPTGLAILTYIAAALFISGIMIIAVTSHKSLKLYNQKQILKKLRKGRPGTVGEAYHNYKDACEQFKAWAWDIFYDFVIDKSRGIKTVKDGYDLHKSICDDPDIEKFVSASWDNMALNSLPSSISNEEELEFACKYVRKFSEPYFRLMQMYGKSVGWDN